jgi:hypothetical protein
MGARQQGYRPAVALLRPGRIQHAPVLPWEEKFAGLVLRCARLARAGSGRRRAGGVLRVFVLAERLASLGHRKLPLRAGNVLSFEIQPFPGRPLPLDGDADLTPGEQVARLNRRAEGRWPAIIQVNELAKADLRALADLARRQAFPREVRAVWAETILYPLLAHYGFHTRAAPRTLRTRLLRIYFLGLFAAYGLDGLVRARRGRAGHFQLGEAWLSLKELNQRFPAAAHPGDSPAGSC